MENNIEIALDIVLRHPADANMPSIIDECLHDIREKFDLGQLDSTTFKKFSTLLWKRREYICNVLLVRAGVPVT